MKSDLKAPQDSRREHKGGKMHLAYFPNLTQNLKVNHIWSIRGDKTSSKLATGECLACLLSVLHLLCDTSARLAFAEREQQKEKGRVRRGGRAKSETQPGKIEEKTKNKAGAWLWQSRLKKNNRSEKVSHLIGTRHIRPPLRRQAVTQEQLCLKTERGAVFVALIRADIGNTTPRL